MKTTQNLLAIVVTSLLSLPHIATAETVTQAWVQIYDGPAKAGDDVFATAVDAFGNVAVTGRSFNGSYEDYYTARYSASGSLLWEQRYENMVNGTPLGDCVAYSVVTDSARNVIVTGVTFNDAYTIKYAAADGHVLWANRFHGTSYYDGGLQVKVDKDDNVIEIGYSTGKLFVMHKYAATDGHQLWVQESTATGNGPDGFRAMAVDGQGDVAVTCSTTIKGVSVDFLTAKYSGTDGHMIWQKYFDGPSHGTDDPHGLAMDSAGNVAVTGESFVTGQGADFYTAKYAAADGHLLWEQRWNSGADDYARSVAMDSGGNVFVTGYPYVGVAYHTAKYAAADGRVLWERDFSGPGINGPTNGGAAFAVAVDASGNAVVTGFSATGNNGAPGFSQDFYTVKYAGSDGKLLWQMKYNSPADGSETMFVGGNYIFQTFSSRLALTPDGGAVIVGLSPNAAGNFDYTTIKYREMPNNLQADLSALVSSDGKLSPVFAGDTTSYNTFVSEATASITLTPTVAASGATVTVDGVPVASGTPSGLIALDGGRNEIVITVNSADGATTKTYTVTVIRPDPSHDFNSDNMADILMQNTVTGLRRVWRMNGTSVLKTANIGTRSTQLQIVGSGDFNGDATPDIVFQNTSNGELSVWYLNGAGQRIGSASIGSVSTQVQADTIGDFNGDGKPDILFQNTTTHVITVWFMDGAIHNGSSKIATVSTDQQILGTGDFNHDGRADILFQNKTTGNITFWLMNGTTKIRSYSSYTVAPILQICGTGDFNGDGKPDILFQNTSTGERTIWLMNGRTLIRKVSLGILSLEWDIKN